ncbi:hypothetical protein D3C76_1721130 [compost metagenome]
MRCYFLNGLGDLKWIKQITRIVANSGDIRIWGLFVSETGYQHAQLSKISTGVHSGKTCGTCNENYATTELFSLIHCSNSFSISR